MYEIFAMRNSSVLRIYSELESIHLDPEYQRMGEIWTLEKKQLLIDSIINDFDIPKIYLHELMDGSEQYKYAVIDGRQRLETIWGFLDCSFPLSKDFEYFADNSIKVGGMTYADLAKSYPKIKIKLDSFELPIIIVKTQEKGFIEEMFSRLNEAVPLNAAEKRNALGGPMAETIRKVVKNPFFKSKIRFSTRRYQDMELGAKFLFITYSQSRKERIQDTKKPYLDNLVIQAKKTNIDCLKLQKEVEKVLSVANKIFNNDDALLRSQSMPVIYFMVIKQFISMKLEKHLTRDMFEEFNSLRRENRLKAEEDIASANYEYLEFDRLSQQGTNDGVSIEFRYNQLYNFLKREISNK